MKRAVQSMLVCCLCLVWSAGTLYAIVPCVGGSAGGFACDGVDLLAELPLSSIGGGSGNDVWGWTDPVTGTEYALMGRTNGTAFIDLSDRENPVYVGNLPTETSASSWRDIKTFADHAFIVADNAGSHGMQVFDLSQLRNVSNPPATFSATAVYTDFGSAHNIVINEASGFAYAVDSGSCSGGLHMIDLSTPTSPVFAGCHSASGTVHDAHCVDYQGPDPNHQGKEICVTATLGGSMDVIDVTSKSFTLTLSSNGYSGASIPHQAWFSEDHRYVFHGDEGDESSAGHNTRTYIFDVTDLDNPILLGNYTGGLAAIDHNMYAYQGLLYQANYTTGLRMLDVADVANANLTEVAFFDTRPESDSAVFQGAWSVYPFLGSCTVLVSDIERGLFVLEPQAGGFPIPGCDPPDPAFTVSCAPASLTIQQNTSAASVCAVSSQNGYTGSVSLSCAGAPAGVSCGFVPASVSPPVDGSSDSRLTISVAPGAATGSFNFDVEGNDGATIEVSGLTVTVIPEGGNGPQIATYDTAHQAPSCLIPGSSCDTVGLIDGRANLGPEPNQPNTIANSCADGSSGSYHSDESNDRLVVSTLDGADFTAGATVQIDATVFAWNTGAEDTLDLYFAADANNPSWLFITSLVTPIGGTQTLSAQYTLPSGTLQAVRAQFRYQGSASACTAGSFNDRDDLVFAVGGGAPGNTPPVVTITAPADGSSFDQGTNVTFTGTATDAEDGTISGSLSWSSSLDGALGSGATVSTSTLSLGSHTITAAVTDSGGAASSNAISVSIVPVGGGCSDCIDWNATGTVSYSNQDSAANVTVEDGGDTLLLLDNTWRRTTQSFVITPNTVVELEFSSTVQGEIQALGFDEDDVLTNDIRIFQLYGGQNWSGSNHDFDNYAGGGAFTTYQIPVGQFYTGTMFMVLVNDNDAGAGNDSRFRNVRLFESTPPPSGCAAEVDFSGGAAGWSNSGSSSCSRGDFVVGTPTQVVSGGVVTQLAGDHTTGSGNAFFTAVNTSNGVDDVDGGNCIASSPVYPVTAASDVSVWYYHGQRDAGDDPSGDFFLLEMSIDGGASWTTMASVGDVTTNAAWTEATASAAAGDQVQFRIQASDGGGPGDLVEAGVDDVTVCPQ